MYRPRDLHSHRDLKQTKSERERWREREMARERERTYLPKSKGGLMKIFQTVRRVQKIKVVVGKR